ncbi:DUF2185 domain-containing protein [Sulfidibacter corallicola]|uniref:DUF2185 domain-containing protein n=1 Tax=Sulfidibacter corallicola TaxID=2818388 RepID=A0A8A4U657_SULCO|nr:DUF2185 domain-containing protein [Sulfidibacter corallicola]QTD54235.1 DUF2185 domain-containing protein [Sulfidibacter corallicola]
MKIQVGYIIASHDVIKSGKSIGYLYREEPDSKEDSGWRVFSGLENKEYVENANNFSMYNASTIVEIDPLIATVLETPYPASFERDEESGCFVRIKE